MVPREGESHEGGTVVDVSTVVPTCLSGGDVLMGRQDVGGRVRLLLKKGTVDKSQPTANCDGFEGADDGWNEDAVWDGSGSGRMDDDEGYDWSNVG